MLINTRILGYSLGGSQVADLFQKASPEEKKLLDKYDDIVLVNPGASPFATDVDDVENMLNDERTTLLTNRSDIISGLYQQYAHADRTYYGNHIFNPLTAHGDEQFGSNPNKEQNVGEIMANIGL